MDDDTVTMNRKELLRAIRDVILEWEEQADKRKAIEVDPTFVSLFVLHSAWYGVLFKALPP